MYICDTNNHCIRKCYYDIGQVTTIAFVGVPKTSIEFHDKDAVGDVSAKKRKALKSTEVTNMRCEGD